MFTYTDTDLHLSSYVYIYIHIHKRICSCLCMSVYIYMLRSEPRQPPATPAEAFWTLRLLHATASLAAAWRRPELRRLLLLAVEVGAPLFLQNIVHSTCINMYTYTYTYVYMYMYAYVYVYTFPSWCLSLSSSALCLSLCLPLRLLYLSLCLPLRLLYSLLSTISSCIFISVSVCVSAAEFLYPCISI